ncbi:hypothetical protein [uncultured Sphingomonas sp.]
MADWPAVSTGPAAAPIVRATAGPNRPIADGWVEDDDPLGATAR